MNKIVIAAITVFSWQPDAAVVKKNQKISKQQNKKLRIRMD